MVQVNVRVADVKTIHTDNGNRVDQPLIEVTLEVNKVGETEKYEIKFTEILSKIAYMTNLELLELVENLVHAYVRTAYRGRSEIDPETGEWIKASLVIDKTFIVEV